MVDLERELMLFGRTPHDDLSDGLSMAIGRVTYPKAPVAKVSRKTQDAYDRIFNNFQKSASWRIV